MDLAGGAAGGYHNVALQGDGARGGEEKHTSQATSWAVTMRPIAVSAARSLLYGSGRPALCRGAPGYQLPGVSSVRVEPGWTQVTLMPWGPSSAARFLVSATHAGVADAADDGAPRAVPPGPRR